MCSSDLRKEEFLKKLDRFKNLDDSIFGDFIKAKLGRLVLDNLDSFEENIRIEAMDKLVESIEGKINKKTLYDIIEHGAGEVVLKRLEKFNDVDHSEIVSKITDNGYGVSAIPKYLHRLNVDHKETAFKMIDGRGLEIGGAHV